ncbi:MAG: DUF2846 domain-containing protein [Candidatus Latescibacterota bacterium]|nr:MAG: DUF2846 domain-containing protein [Candidatus Latescibacterota bacterium]
MSRTLFLIMLALPLVVGCAGTSKAPAEDTEAAMTFKVPDDKGVVYLYRLGRAVAAANVSIVKVNSLEAGGTGPGTFFRWELKPGTYSFSASTSESSKTVQLQVEAGKLYFIEQNIRLGLSEGRVQLKEVDEKTGKKNIQGMKMLVSAYVPEE